MSKKETGLTEWLQNSDNTRKELVLYLSLLPSPVSIDILVSLSDTSIMAVLSAIEGLKSKNVITEKRGKEKGLYYLNMSGLTESIRNYVTESIAGKALAKITGFYRGTSDTLKETTILNIAELYQTISVSEEGLDIIKKAADILSRLGQDEKAVKYYDRCLSCMADRELTEEKAATFLDCVLGRVSLLIYHMSATDEIALLNRAKVLAHRFKKWVHLAKIEIAMAQILQTLGEHRKAFRCFNSFRVLATKLGNPDTLKPTILTTCEFLFWRGMFSEVVNHYEKMVGSLEEFGDDEASLKAAALVGYCFVISGRVARGMGMIEAVRAKGSILDLQQVVIFSDQMKVLSLFELRKISEAEPYLDRLYTISEESLGHLISRAIRDEKAYLLCLKGEYKKAFEYHQSGVLKAQSLGWKHQCGPWLFEYLDILESKGFVDEDVNYDSEIRRLVKWDDLRMRGVAFRYRALRNIEKKRSSETVLSDLKNSERYLEQAGAEVELARTRIELGRHLQKKDPKAARSYLEKAWVVLSRIDKNLFPSDLLERMPEVRKLEVMVERMIQINESLGTIQNQDVFLEKMLEVAMEFVMATRGMFLIIEPGGEPRQAVSRNLDPVLFETEKFKMVRTLVVDAAQKDEELIIPRKTVDGVHPYGTDTDAYEKVFNDADIQSFIGMPARLSGTTYGYLCLDNRLGGQPFTPSQLPLVRFLCSQIGVGLKNLDTYKEMRGLKDHFEEEAIFYKKEMGIMAPVEIVGSKSEGIKRVVDRIRQVAPADSSVLILGETGVGKELVAKAIHNLSARKDGPFIPVNLAAIPTELVASELFGHEKGAFTGALERRKGRFELANGGTIFLDEIGDLPSAVQVKLLRVLQEGMFEKLGSSQSTKSDFRVIAATNKNLALEVERGSFRQDLYYRLDVFPIHVPPLRERKEDIPELVRYFVERSYKKLGRGATRIPREEMKKLTNHAWPGNVRELEHRVEQALILSDGKTISFPEPMQSQNNSVTLRVDTSEVMTLKDMERDYIERVLNITRWKVMGKGGAASLLGMKSTTLFSRLKKLGIRKSDYKA